MHFLIGVLVVALFLGMGAKLLRGLVILGVLFVIFLLFRVATMQPEQHVAIPELAYNPACRTAHHPEPTGKPPQPWDNDLICD